MKQAKVLGRHTVAGWIVVRMMLPAGSSYGLIVGADGERARLGARAIWVRGRIAGANSRTGAAVVREPGTFRGHSEAMDAGRYTLTATEDAEWWCVDQKANGGAEPSEVLPLRLSPGQSFTVPAGSHALVCNDGGDTFGGGDTITASTQTYGLIFEKGRAP